MQEILLFKNSCFAPAHILSPLWKLEKFTHLSDPLIGLQFPVLMRQEG